MVSKLVMSSSRSVKVPLLAEVDFTQVLKLMSFVKIGMNVGEDVTITISKLSPNLLNVLITSPHSKIGLASFISQYLS